MDDFPWAPGTRSNSTATAIEPAPALPREPDAGSDLYVEAHAEAFGVETDVRAEPRVEELRVAPVLTAVDPRARYDAHHPGRVRAILFSVAVAAIAGAVYWSAGNPTQPTASPTQAAAPTTAPAEPPAQGSAPPTVTQPAESRTAPTDVQPQPESTSPVQDAASSASVPPPASDATAAPAPASGTEPTPASAKAPGDSDARRRAAQRKREQAERDALATQRLIARQLGDTARAAPERPPASAQ